MQVLALGRHRGDDVTDAKVGGQLIDGLVLAPAQASGRECQNDRPCMRSSLNVSRVDWSKPGLQCAVDVKGESLRTHSIVFKQQLPAEGLRRVVHDACILLPMYEHLRTPER